VTELVLQERPARGEPQGLLVLHHGRGSHEGDLIGLADLLDPSRRLHVAAPRAPLQLPGSPGFHWYVVPRVGFPEPESFAAAYAALGECHDQLWERTGLTPSQTVLGGFSMGAVMSYATGLGPGRPAPAGILAFSGFIPTVEGWSPQLDDRTQTGVFISHGTADPVIGVEFARIAHSTLVTAGLPVEYHETDAGHYIEPSQIPLAADFVARTIPA
jgi:phospholipase/carboxylesterase